MEKTTLIHPCHPAMISQAVLTNSYYCHCLLAIAYKLNVVITSSLTGVA